MRKKSNHKHIYNRHVLIQRSVKFQKDYLYNHATVCSICGKYGNIDFLECEEDDGRCVLLTTKEILKKYKDLEIVDWNTKDKYLKG
jgi:hypothetical protein